MEGTISKLYKILYLNVDFNVYLNVEYSDSNVEYSDSFDDI